jgi:hypothetical protein
MTPYRRYLGAWALIMGVGALFGLASMYLWQWFAVAFLAWIFAAKPILDKVTCPKCGTPLYYNGPRFAERRSAPNIFSRTACRACGYDLTHA